ncbi:DNA mismatch repair protein MSH6 [Tanacetum coccineum]
MHRLIWRFCEHHISLRHMVSIGSELDVLISIAIASDLYEGPTGRPLIVNTSSENEAPFIAAKNLGHPVLRNGTLSDGTFVPNELDVLISIAISSDLYEGPTGRPLIVNTSSENEAPFIAAKNLGHPVLRNGTLSDGTFVPNDHGSATSIGCLGGASDASRAASCFSPSKPPLILTHEIASSLHYFGKTGKHLHFDMISFMG